MNGEPVKFRKWLEDKGALAKYIRNRLCELAGTHHKSIGGEITDWFLVAFNWRESDEGGDYWRDLDHEWDQLLSLGRTSKDPGMPLDDPLGLSLLLTELETG